MNVDDMQRVQQQARDLVQEIHESARQEFYEPQLEREDLAEYDGLSPEEHGRLMETVGKDKYQEYADYGERMRKRWGQPTLAEHGPGKENRERLEAVG